MDLNKIKCFGKAELLQKLKQSGFIEVVNILEDKEINGQQLINLREFEIFKWKLSNAQKKCLWDCISEIKAKPHILVRKENKKLVTTNSLPRRSSSFSDNAHATNLLKGKLESLLDPAGANIGSAQTLPNKHIRQPNNEKTAEVASSRNKPPPPPPPANISSMVNQSGANNNHEQRVVKKPALPLPREINNKPKGTGDVRKPQTSRFPKSNSPDIPTEMYMDMQPPANMRQIAVIADENEDYLTPKEMSGPAPNFKNVKGSLKNSNISKNNIDKSTRVPLPPPLPNKNSNSSKNDNFKEDKSWSNIGKKLPKIEKPNEEEDTYEPPPKFGNAHNYPRDFKGSHNNHNNQNRKPQPRASPNLNVISTSNFFVEVVTNEAEEESNYEMIDNPEKNPPKKFSGTKGYVQFPNNEESDDTYEPPPALNSRVLPNKYTTRVVERSNTYNNSSNICDSGTKADSMNAKKPTIKELENVLTISTQEPVLTKITSTLNSIFRSKRSKNVYENHNIISEKDENVVLLVNNRPLPKTPIESAEHKNKESKSVRNPVLKLNELQRKNGSLSDSQDGYVTLVQNMNAPNEFPRSIPSKQPLDRFEEAEQTYGNITETAKDNISHFSTRRNENKSIRRVDSLNKNTKSNDSDNNVEEELVDYGNTTSHNSQMPQISLQDKLAMLLAEQLKQRNLITNEVESTHPDIESDFEDDDDDNQPVYGNTLTPITNTNPSPGTHNLSAHSSHPVRNNSPTHISKINNEGDDDLDQPVYNNTDQRELNVSTNLFENKSAIQNPLRFDKESDDDHDQPIYDNTPTNNQRRQDLSQNPLSFENKPIMRNPSEVDQQNHNNQRGSSYITIDEPINPPRPNFNKHNQIKSKLPARSKDSFGNNPPTSHLLPNQRKDNVPKNSFGGKSSSSTSINSNVSDENSDDASISPNLGNRIPIQMRPLPEPPNRFVTPSSSDEFTSAFKKTPPVIGTKGANYKPKVLDKKIAPLPRPPALPSTTRLNYDRVLVNLPGEQNLHSQEEVTIREKEDDGSIFNINDEPYFRNTDRKGAKWLLRHLEDGAFLFRPSRKHFLVLTIKYDGKFYNVGIERSSNNKIRLNAEGDNDANDAPEFATLQHFVNYFKEQAVTIEDKGTVVEITLKPVLPPDLF